MIVEGGRMRAVDGRARVLLLAFPFLGCGGRSDLGLVVLGLPEAGDGRSSGGGGLDANGSDGRLDPDAGDGGRRLDAGSEPTCENHTSTESCGASCSFCPGPPAHGHATCDGAACGIACDPGFLACNAACVDLQTDGANCGVCGHDCLGGECTAGQCQAVTLLSGLDWPTRIAVDATNIYWTSSEAGTVTKMPIAGGSQTVLATGQKGATGIAVDASSVYWATYLNNALTKMPQTGGPFGNLYSAVDPQDGPFAVAVDASNVYWTSFWGGTVLAMPKKGGAAPTTLFSGANTNPDGVAVDATYLYFSYLGNVEPTDGTTIMKLPLAGGAPTTVTTVPTVVSDIAVDASRIYWTTEYDGTVVQMPLGGGSPTTLVSGLFYPDGIAVDAAAIYWTTTNDPTKADFSSGTIMRLAKPPQ
jgi:hypothetical protein